MCSATWGIKDAPNGALTDTAIAARCDCTETLPAGMHAVVGKRGVKLCSDRTSTLRLHDYGGQRLDELKQKTMFQSRSGARGIHSLKTSLHNQFHLISV